MADNPVWDEEENELRVMNGKCNTCIFGPNSILMARDVRKLVAKAREDAEHGNIICHKTIKAFAGETKGVMCRGFWDRYFRNTFLGRLAAAWDLIHWWPQPKEEAGK